MFARQAIAAGLVALLTVAGATAASADAAGAGSRPAKIVGAGSTEAQRLIDSWRTDLDRIEGLDLSYQGVGATTGRNFFVIHADDVAASEIPFLPDERNELKRHGDTFQYLPEVVGGLAFAFHLHDTNGDAVRRLRLTPHLVAGIFTGVIRWWNNPKIARVNPHLSLPNERVHAVVHSEGAGSSAVLGEYLRAVTPGVWSSFSTSSGLASIPVAFWPQIPGSIAQNGDDGVANWIGQPGSRAEGSIGYVASSTAELRRLPIASLKNEGHHFVRPTKTSIEHAVRDATLARNGIADLTNAFLSEQPATYSLPFLTYLITHTSDEPPAKGGALGDVLSYATCQGQSDASTLGFAPITREMARHDLDAIGEIRGASAPLSLNACRGARDGP